LSKLTTKTVGEMPVVLVVTYVVVIFLGTILLDVIFREVVLPYIFPGLHAGNGFMLGGDSLGYHQKAIEVSELIRNSGWSEWKLRPFSTLDAPVGIASAIYSIFGNSPIVLLPFNAAVHAGSALCLLLILRPIVGGNPRYAIIATLPFVIFPTAFYWHSQLHKDGIFIFGIYLFLCGWLLQFRDTPNSWQRQLISSALLVIGVILIWSVRTYMLIVLAAIGVVMALLCGLFENDWRKCGQLTSMEAAWRMVQRIGYCVAIVWVGGTGFLQTATAYSGHIEVTQAQAQAQTQIQTQVQAGRSQRVVCSGWEPTEWIPQPVDRLAFSIANTRRGYFSSVYADAASTIDRDQCLNNFYELVGYFPRALQIGLFAPFPWQWLEASAQGKVQTMRLVAGGEMLGAYFALIFCALAVWYRRKAPWLWTLLAFVIPILLLLSIVTPNIGTLHRMRYGYFMILVGIGVGYLFRVLLEKRQSRLSTEKL